MTYMNSKYRGTAAYDQTRDLMIQAARNESTVQYRPAISRILGFDDRETGKNVPAEIGQLCGEISEDENLAGRPRLSAVNQQNHPGPGFFTLARALGLLAGTLESVELAYWMEELRRVHEFFSFDRYNAMPVFARSIRTGRNQ